MDKRDKDELPPGYARLRPLPPFNRKELCTKLSKAALDRLAYFEKWYVKSYKDLEDKMPEHKKMFSGAELLDEVSGVLTELVHDELLKLEIMEDLKTRLESLHEDR